MQRLQRAWYKICQLDSTYQERPADEGTARICIWVYVLIHVCVHACVHVQDMWSLGLKTPGKQGVSHGTQVWGGHPARGTQVWKGHPAQGTPSIKAEKG